MAFLEMKRGQVSRIVSCSSHPEHYKRMRTKGVNTNQELSAGLRFAGLEERLLDLASLMAFGNVIRPSLMLSTNWFASYVNGIVLRKTIF